MLVSLYTEAGLLQYLITNVQSFVICNSAIDALETIQYVKFQHLEIST